MAETVYICEGSCGAVVPEADYEAGLTTCQHEDCDRHGEEFTEQRRCESCRTVFAPDEDHSCA